eukprot:TRINITY_DN1765_c0_g2_i2.p1 TRINITY_DN1765_c0_g2~~TRINITY_DN1765_c0_g2_i2.p1  ORF type:complete len:102 (-),score=38.03 TRINITY_DN1765_c0_g2_i2:108-413(-)
MCIRDRQNPAASPAKEKPKPAASPQKKPKAAEPREKNGSEPDLAKSVEKHARKIIEEHTGDMAELTGRVVRTRLEQVMGRDLSAHKKTVMKITLKVFADFA